MLWSVIIIIMIVALGGLLAGFFVGYKKFQKEVQDRLHLHRVRMDQIEADVRDPFLPWSKTLANISEKDN